MKKFLNGFACLYKANSARHSEEREARRENPENKDWTAALPMVARSDEKCAFTLAETLIVIVVLGVVATLTIPALVNKNKESVAKTKVRKAMAAYESALNKMIIENDLKSHETLTAWAGDADSGCANSTNYFKKVQDVNGCIFKTADGIWWNISDIERPLIAFKQDDLDQTKANDANDKTAFVLVGRFGTDGSLRVDDLAYETANNTANSKAQVEKLYTLLDMKKAQSGEQAQNCDDIDIACKYLRGDALPLCSGENKSCIEYTKTYSDGTIEYNIFDSLGYNIGYYHLNEYNGNTYKSYERFYYNGKLVMGEYYSSGNVKMKYFGNTGEECENNDPYIYYDESGNETCKCCGL